LSDAAEPLPPGSLGPPIGAFDHSAIAGYLPGMQALIEERLSEWARETEFSATLCALALLIRGYDWDFPPQDLSYRSTTIPPEPRDGLLVRLHARH
jgi:hypothetical protein